jgi:UDP-N-acetylglucosamine enolpyruvyl transferase
VKKFHIKIQLSGGCNHGARHMELNMSLENKSLQDRKDFQYLSE